MTLEWATSSKNQMCFFQNEGWQLKYLPRLEQLSVSDVTERFFQNVGLHCPKLAKLQVQPIVHIQLSNVLFYDRVASRFREILYIDTLI